MTAPRLQIRGARKAFGPTQALAGVDLTVAPGEVLALIGENGAGKSTLMKVLSGVHRPDAGMLHLDGAAYAPADPVAARRAGVVMIYQELTVAPDLTVAENIVLGNEPKRFGLLVDRAAMRDTATAALQRLGRDDLDLDQPVRELSVGQRQMVEIARAMTTSPRVVVFDEPTSSLTRDDVEHLFAIIRRLRDDGVAVIYISHFLEECRAVASRYCVLRDGTSVTTGDMATATEADLIAAMVGRDVDDLYPRSERERGEVILDCRGVQGSPLPRRVDLSLHRGEVVGLFGLVGSGRTEFLRCCFGLSPMDAGSIQFDGDDLTGASPHDWWRRGVGVVSEDRKGEGLLLVRSIADNTTLTRLAPFCTGPWLHERAQHRATAEWIDRLGVRCQGPAQAIGGLSGGNQQKVAIGRLLQHECQVLLLDEPTRGIDVGAKARIYQLIDQAAASGCAVLMISSYVPELLGTCDRIAVMCRGELGASRPVAEWDEHAIMAAAIGADHEEPDHVG